MLKRKWISALSQIYFPIISTIAPGRLKVTIHHYYMGGQWYRLNLRFTTSVFILFEPYGGATFDFMVAHFR